MISIHSMLGLHVTDDGLDRGSAFHLAFDDDSGSPDPAGDPDPEFVPVIMAAISLVVMGALDRDAGILLDIGDGTVECVAVQGILVQRGTNRRWIVTPEDWPGTSAAPMAREGSYQSAQRKCVGR
jgi:hypothetical protein